MENECFISYSRMNSNFVDEVKKILANNNIDYWIDKDDSVAGMDYAANIVKSIKSRKVFILVVSKESIASRHVLNELNTAVNADRIIIPVKIDDIPLSDAFEYYLGKTQWIEAHEESNIWKEQLLEAVQLGLKSNGSIAIELSYPLNYNSLNAKQDSKNTLRADKRKCRMLRYQDLLDLGYTSKKIATKLVENDYINYHGIGEDNEGTPDQWENYIRDDSETFRYVVNGENEIVGDWTIIAITEESARKASEGNLLECEMNIHNTVKICLPGIYHGYILSVSLLPEYRTQKNYWLLLKSLFLQLEEYAEDGVFFKEWIINVFSPEVESLFLSLGFTHVADNREFGKIYCKSFIPFPDDSYLKAFKRLGELYADAE